MDRSCATRRARPVSSVVLASLLVATGLLGGPTAAAARHRVEATGSERPPVVWRSDAASAMLPDGSTELRLAPEQRAVLAAPPPRDMRRTLAVVLPIRSLAPTGGAPAELELRILTDEGAMHWRALDVAWKKPVEMEIPLALTRSGDHGVVSGWSRIRGVELFARTGAHVAVGAPRFVAGRRSDAAWPRPETIAVAAFGPRSVRTRRGALLGVVTDVEGVNLAALQRLAGRVSSVLERLLPGVSAPQGPALLLLTADRDAWFDALSRVSAAMGASLAPGRSEGLTVQGIASVGWDPVLGADRPVIAHELAHALLDRRCWLPDATGWLDEAVAVRVQLHLHPRPGLTEEMRTWRKVPLSRLLDGRPVPPGSYWQAVTVLEMLRLDARYAGRWPALLQAIRQQGGGDLRPLVEPVLGVTMDELQADWESWVSEQPAPAVLEAGTAAPHPRVAAPEADLAR